MAMVGILGSVMIDVSGEAFIEAAACTQAEYHVDKVGEEKRKKNEI